VAVADLLPGERATSPCELRAAFRNFRVDRISGFAILDEPLVDEPGRTLRDLLARYGPDAVRLPDG
jgi:predicted DNA-binding transcriptional regulator YafY